MKPARGYTAGVGADGWRSPVKLGNGIVGNRPTTTRCLLGILPCPQLFWLSLQAVWPLTPCYLELIVPNLDNNDSL